MKIAVGTVVFNDRKSLYRTLSTCHQANYIFVIDGKFPDYDYPSQLSDDGTRDICEQFDNVVLIDCPADEVTKRNRYLQACREYGIDYLLIVDSDEYLYDINWWAFCQNLAKLTTTENILGIWCKNQDGMESVYPRLWKNPGEMEYYRCHNVFKKISNGQLIRGNAEAPYVEGVKITWDASLRTPESEVRTSEYQAKLIAHEKPIKRELFG